MDDTSVLAAAREIEGLLDSDEESPVAVEEETEADEVEVEEVEASAEEEETEESEEEESESDEDDEESESTREDADQADDAPLAEMEKRLQADYTKKTQAAAEARKQAEAEREQTRQVREQYLGTIQALQEHLTTKEPPKPDPALRQSNPAEYAAQVADRQQWEADRAAAAQERQRIEAEQAEEFQTTLRERLAEEQAKLAAALPEFADPAKGPEVKKALATYATNLGFTEQDLANVYDHRLVLLLDKARRYDALQEKAAPVLKKAKEAPVLKPGHRESTSPNKGKRKRVQAAENRLRQTGRPEDAAAWFLESGVLDD